MVGKSIHRKPTIKYKLILLASDKLFYRENYQFSWSTIQFYI